MRVLIVEDEAKMAGLLRRGLEREGMAVDTAVEGEEALWKAEAVDRACLASGAPVVLDDALL